MQSDLRVSPMRHGQSQSVQEAIADNKSNHEHRTKLLHVTIYMRVFSSDLYLEAPGAKFSASVRFAREDSPAPGRNFRGQQGVFAASKFQQPFTNHHHCLTQTRLSLP